MRLLHKIINTLEKNSQKVKDDARHRIGREIYVAEPLAVRQRATFYYDSGATITSIVESIKSTVDGKLTIITENTIYELEKILD